ncbi:peptidoglycan-binding protein [Streptomyces sp. NPDC060184]|uniref:peptidoglycan-binding protein n=1 Tax=Streptomyces sp. NPDC060184 TaxID=3347064 RepID=UPI0036670325
MARAQESGAPEAPRGAPPGTPPGAALAELLRSWWERAGGADPSTRPTQQALASRLGIDQTTLSRYLNRNHPSTAPLRIVEALHVHLRAPAAELDRARAWWRAASEEQVRPASVGGASPPEPASTGVVPHPAPGPPAPGPHACGAPGWLHSWWALPVTLALLVTSFLAGALLQGGWAPQGSAAASAAGAPGVVLSDDADPHWPLVKKKKHEDQFTLGRAVQHLLVERHYDLEVDGIIGDRTQAAVMDFQRGRQLPTDGKVGDDTWPWLVVDVKPGAEGEAVLAVQELLNRTGRSATEVSGIFTPTTARAVRLFQEYYRLPATGWVDQETWRFLLVHQQPASDTPAFQKAQTRSPAASG